MFFRGAPNHINLEGGAQAKTRNFVVKIFQKVSTNALFCLFFFQKFDCGSKKLVEMGSLQ